MIDHDYICTLHLSAKVTTSYCWLWTRQLNACLFLYFIETTFLKYQTSWRSCALVQWQTTQSYKEAVCLATQKIWSASDSEWIRSEDPHPRFSGTSILLLQYDTNSHKLNDLYISLATRLMSSMYYEYGCITVRLSWLCVLSLYWTQHY